MSFKAILAFVTLKRAVLLASLLVALAAVYVALLPLINGHQGHDVAAHSHIAKRIVEGANLYRDAIDPNAPFFFYFYTPSALVANGLGLHYPLVVNYYLVGWLMVGLVLGWLVVSRTLAERSATFRHLWAAAILMVSFGLPEWWQFGQREHLIAVLFFPYCMLIGWRTENKSLPTGLAVCVGIAAGIAVSLKPYYLLLPILLELYLLLRRWSIRAFLRPEIAAGVLVLVLNVLLTLLVERDYFAVVSLLLDSYGAWDAPWSELKKEAWPCAAMILAIVFVPGRKLSSWRQPLLLASTGALGLALLQGKGYPYQFFVAEGLSAAALIGAVFEWLDSLGSEHRWRRWLLPIVGLVFLSQLFAKVDKLTPKLGSPQSSRFVRLIRQHAPNKPVYFFSTSLPPAFPSVTHAGAQWKVRYQHLLLLPGFYADQAQLDRPTRYHPPASMSEREKIFFEGIIDDLLAAPPVLLFVDQRRRKQSMGKQHFDYLEYFSQSEEFSKLMTRYQRKRTLRGYAVYLRRQ